MRISKKRRYTLHPHGPLDEGLYSLYLRSGGVKRGCGRASHTSPSNHMELTLTTPALLFPAISLLLLAYTNRFLALANLVRKLHEEYKRGEQNKILIQQIHSLRRRIRLVRYMQGLGVFSFVFCVITMYTIYMNWNAAVKYEF